MNKKTQVQTMRAVRELVSSRAIVKHILDCGQKLLYNEKDGNLSVQRKVHVRNVSLTVSSSVIL